MPVKEKFSCGIKLISLGQLGSLFGHARCAEVLIISEFQKKMLAA
jgi:hypothetical protein